MLKGHLSDEQIQELALDGAGLAPDLAAHAETCVDCQLKVRNYRLLINAVEKQPAPAFNFNLAAAVVSQIEAPLAKAATKGLWWLCAATILVILTGAAIYFGEYMTGIVDELKSLSIYLIAISGAVLITMLVIDQYKTFHRKMKLLDTP